MVFAASRKGRIIFLNGVSSSGKSSIAAQLLSVLDTPYFAMSVDVINGLRAKERTLELGEDGIREVLVHTRAGFHRAVAGMAHAGNDVVMDHVLSEPWRLIDCLAVMNGLDVVLVGVHCDLEELRRREISRGDREIGQAEGQLAMVHAHGLYDIECDTSVLSARACALRIKDFLARPAGTRAFDRLRVNALTAGTLRPDQLGPSVSRGF
ncbi:chloramphenicol phosphotransferase CPT family protein [Actinokineospora sp. UTMC 2448]|uniref:chloramphenicol phosphotransferase CPT family protein n=1 Tax=Actinokineospora sp. UTMC 2448 TaxID=2268449 RepID=UPI002164754F|nr:chloramphenicol phosphotransferase CPT family protein [Actinokineospora sp. UTMC 2448]UVS79515.1 Chloramphenicol 3-O phosphotransferase [Actinokineospora sp. UTMC 2448]